MYLLFILLMTILPQQEEISVPEEQESAVQTLSEEIGDPSDLSAYQRRAEANFIHHRLQKAIEDLSYVIENLKLDSLKERKILLRCLCIRHICYSLINETSQATADLERIKPLLLDAELKDDFPDYIEGLRLLVSHEENRD